MSNQEKNNNTQGENTQGNGNNTQEAEVKVGFFTRIGNAIDDWAKHPVSNTVNGVKKAGGWIKEHPVQSAIGAGAIGYAGYKAYQHFHSGEEEEDETVEVVELPVVPALPEPPVVPQIEEHTEVTEVEVPVLEENPTDGIFDEAEI